MRFLTAAALRQRKEEEEKAREQAKKVAESEVQQQAAAALEQARLLLERNKSRKRKKRRKRRTLRTSSLRGRARRRQRQWYACNAGFPGDVSLRAVFPSVVVRPEMLGILAGMYQTDSGALIVDPGSGICKACFAGFTPRSVFLGCRQARGQVGFWLVYWC